MSFSHQKEFGIYHGDAFNNTTLLIDEADSQEEAEAMVDRLYEGRTDPDGADQVNIIDKAGSVTKEYTVI